MSALRRDRAAAQLLHRPRGGALAVVEHLLAVQAQDLRAARLALRARAKGLRAADVDAALNERGLVVGWLMRGTLHLVGRDDYRWLLALTAPGRVTANARRLKQEGVSPDDADRAVKIMERALGRHGPLTRPELAERIAAHAIRIEGQATPHLLMLAALRGVAVLGPLRGDVQAFVLARDWLGDEPALGERDRALAELARRYLRGHGPAGAADLAAWAGLPLRDARAGLEAIASELSERRGLVDLARRAAAPDAIAPRLLPAFDPYLLGWKDRGFAVPAKHARRVHPGGGMVRATATVDGRAVGTWTLPGGRVELDLFGRPRVAERDKLQREAADVARFLTNARPS
ncbi:MAG TPA: winged helix DNA-binding domain-containing protein [Solirubrobacteraceae bacterium]